MSAPSIEPVLRRDATRRLTSGAPIVGLAALGLLGSACGLISGDRDWRGAQPEWAVPIATEAEAIEAARFVSNMTGDVRVNVVGRGTLGEMRVGVGRLPELPEVGGVRTDDVWRIDLESDSVHGQFVFQAPSGVLLEAIYHASPRSHVG